MPNLWTKCDNCRRQRLCYSYSEHSVCLSLINICGTALAMRVKTKVFVRVVHYFCRIWTKREMCLRTLLNSTICCSFGNHCRYSPVIACGQTDTTKPTRSFIYSHCECLKIISLWFLTTLQSHFMQMCYAYSTCARVGICKKIKEDLELSDTRWDAMRVGFWTVSRNESGALLICLFTSFLL